MRVLFRFVMSVIDRSSIIAYNKFSLYNYLTENFDFLLRGIYHTIKSPRTSQNIFILFGMSESFAPSKINRVTPESTHDISMSRV